MNTQLLFPLDISSVRFTVCTFIGHWFSSCYNTITVTYHLNISNLSNSIINNTYLSSALPKTFTKMYIFLLVCILLPVQINLVPFYCQTCKAWTLVSLFNFFFLLFGSRVRVRVTSWSYCHILVISDDIVTVMVTKSYGYME